MNPVRRFVEIISHENILLLESSFRKIEISVKIQRPVRQRRPYTSIRERCPRLHRSVLRMIISHVSKQTGACRETNSFILIDILQKRISNILSLSFHHIRRQHEGD